MDILWIREDVHYAHTKRFCDGLKIIQSRNSFIHPASNRTGSAVNNCRKLLLGNAALPKHVS